MIRFHKRYFFLFLLLFLIELLIALFVHDTFIRPFFGDFLVVFLIFYFFKSFLNIDDLKLAIGVLLFAYLVETLQYCNFVKFIGLQDSKIANIIIGNTFAWLDLLAYTLGIILVIIVEKLFRSC